MPRKVEYVIHFCDVKYRHPASWTLGWRIPTETPGVQAQPCTVAKDALRLAQEPVTQPLVLLLVRCVTCAPF
jgi:hypothetical protein